MSRSYQDHFDLAKWLNYADSMIAYYSLTYTDHVLHNEIWDPLPAENAQSSHNDAMAEDIKRGVHHFYSNRAKQSKRRLFFPLAQRAWSFWDYEKVAQNIKKRAWQAFLWGEGRSEGGGNCGQREVSKSCSLLLLLSSFLDPSLAELSLNSTCREHLLASNSWLLVK